MLEASLAAGVAAGGGHALLGGVLPTPGAALAVRRHGFDLAAVVSASHNPYRDNGIKFFGPQGTKISDDQEAAIEAIVAGDVPTPATAVGRVRELHGAPGRLPARPGAALPRPGPERRAGAAGLRQRRHLPRGARDLPPPGRRRGRRGRRARRAQHQRRRGLHPRRRPGRPGRGGRLRRRLRLRRRRRPRAGRGPHRRRGRRRRAPGPGRAAPARGRPPAGRRRRRDRDDQLRLPHGHGAGGRGRGHHARSATATCWPSCSGAAGPWAASSRATSSTPASCPRATAPPRRC